MVYKLKYGLITFARKFYHKHANEIIKKCNSYRMKKYLKSHGGGLFSTLFLPFYYIPISDTIDVNTGFANYIRALKYKTGHYHYLRRYFTNADILCFYKVEKDILMRDKHLYFKNITNKHELKKITDRAKKDLKIEEKKTETRKPITHTIPATAERKRAEKRKPITHTIPATAERKRAETRKPITHTPPTAETRAEERKKAETRATTTTQKTYTTTSDIDDNLKNAMILYFINYITGGKK